MESTVLVVNPGSSSRKYALYSGNQEQISSYYESNGDEFLLTVTNTDGESTNKVDSSIFDNAIAHFLEQASEAGIKQDSIVAVGVRVVAPGRRLMDNKLIDEDLESYLRSITSKAPLHLNTLLDEIHKIKSELSQVPVFAISDTEFHRTLSHEARNYAIPKDDADRFDIYRFGYHGISMKSVVHQMKEELGLDYRRMIICHLGSGSSITAVRDWKSIDTSMGYSPLEGLEMATRSGNIDVEAALELKKQLGFDDQQLEAYLNKQSGLLGLSGFSNDIRELLSAEATGNDAAKFALDSMVYRIRKYIGQYYAILEGLDALVFTATVGERSAPIRRRVCEPLKHMGIYLDTYQNDATDTEIATISTPDSPVAIHVIPTDETREIARQTLHLLARQ